MGNREFSESDVKLPAIPRSLRYRNHIIAAHQVSCQCSSLRLVAPRNKKLAVGHMYRKTTTNIDTPEKMRLVEDLCFRPPAVDFLARTTVSLKFVVRKTKC